MSYKETLDPWWEEEDKDKAKASSRRLFENYVSQDRQRLTAYNAYNRMYTNRKIHGNDYISMYTAAFATEGNKYSRVPLNVAKIIIDGAHARVTRSGIQIKFLTTAGNPSKKRGARQMERFVAHKDHAENMKKEADCAELDSMICGTGAVKTCPHPKIDDIMAYRVRCADIFIDPAEGAVTMKPTNMFQRMWVSRSQLKAMYPEYAEKIRKAGKMSKEPFPTRYADRKTLVEVVEGWKLPSWKGADDGKHIIFIDGQVLELDEWDLIDFPLTFTRWKTDPTIGFWGIGLCEELMGPHFNINSSLFHIHRSVELSPKPIFFRPVGAKVSEGQIGNIAGLIVDFIDVMPKLELPVSVPRDIVDLIQVEWGHALEIGRLAALSLPESTGGGFETGQALRDFNDIQSTELAPNFKDWQDFKVRLAEQVVTSGKLVADRAKAAGRTYKVILAKDKNTLEEIDWENIDLDPKEDSYVITAMPASALSQTFAGKKADVIDMMNVGLIDQETALALLDFPDLEDFFDMVKATRKAIEMDIETMLDEGVFIPFDPNDNLRLGLKLYQTHISRARANGVEQERISLLEDAKQQILKFIEEEQTTTRNMAEGFGPGLPGSPAALDIDGSSPQATQGPAQ